MKQGVYLSPDGESLAIYLVNDYFVIILNDDYYLVYTVSWAAKVVLKDWHYIGEF